MSDSHRDVMPDALRGFALWGIIVVNVAYFSTSVENGVSRESLGGTADALTAFLVLALASGKFYLLFSFLFGYSASYLLANEDTGRTRWVSRSFGLVGLGFAHAVLLWMGDILFLYGLLGFILLTFYRKARTVILRWIFWLYGAFALVLLGLAFLTWFGENAGFSAEVSPVPVFEEVVRHGNYLQSIPARFELWYTRGIFAILFQSILTLVAFLTGILASRQRFLDAAGMPAHLLNRLLGWGLGLGLPLQLAIAGAWLSNELSVDRTETVAILTFIGSFLSAPLLSAGYVGLIAWLVRSNSQVIRWFRVQGRMALTIYLLQSVGLSLIFSAWGVGLYQAVPYWGAVLIALALTSVLAVVAKLWLTKFSYGPMERALSLFSRLFIRRSNKN